MPTYITTAGFKLLKDEFEHLKSVERPKVVNEVAEAAAQGDRSENAEYIYGKRRLREIMQVIDPATPRGDRIFFGATVTLYDEEQDGEIVYQIVGPLDVLDDKHISYQSPVGQALLGKSVDESVVIRTPKEVRHVTICEVEYI